ncbi:MAG: TlpA family protein disulfide reductase [Deltaproteobacteria bacterium]|nr:TlpA family protein disulfide reductase [Deltaproteobacteria bacterium]
MTNQPARLPSWLKSPLFILAVVVGLGLLFGNRGRMLAKGTRLDARTVETSDGRLPLFGPELTVLNFWGESCPPCREEAPELTSLHSRLSGRGRVLGVSVDSDSLQDASRTARELGMRYPIALLDRPLQSTFAVDVLPTTYVIDSSGVVRWSRVGALGDAEVREILAGPRPR